MKNFVVKETRAPFVGRFRIGQQDDERVKLVFETQLASGTWRFVGSVVLDDDDLIGYFKAGGAKV